jgi:hypothetical protein
MGYSGYNFMDAFEDWAIFFTDSHGRQLISSSGHLGAIQRHYLFDWFRPERKIGS